MRIASISIGRLMVVVSLVALNLAIARGLAASEEKILIVAILPGLILWQVALFRLIRTKGRSRAFWAGFLVAGLLAMLSFVCANQFSRSIGISKDPATGKTRIVVVPGYFGADPMHDLWLGYVTWVAGRFPSLPRTQPVSAVVMFVPQLLVALAGGGFACLVWTVVERSRRDGRRELLAQL